MKYLTAFIDDCTLKPVQTSTRSEPIAPARTAEIADTCDALAFVRAVRSVKVPEFLRLSDAETREYKNVVACLDCGIDPRDHLAAIASFISVQSDNEATNEYSKVGPGSHQSGASEKV